MKQVMIFERSATLISDESTCMLNNITALKNINELVVLLSNMSNSNDDIVLCHYTCLIAMATAIYLKAPEN